MIDKLKNILRKILPKPVKTFLEKARTLALRGGRFYCPVCETGFRKFYPFGVDPRPDACCPGCGSVERHRLLWVALGDLRAKNLISIGGKLLHVAPETCLAERFSKESEYLSIDLDGEQAMMAMDLTAMTFEDNSFDAIVCNHVLEHIPDDRTAMKELYRVLKPGGWASLQVPIEGDITREDLVIDPAERLRLYGQDDHVRQYGHDYSDRLKAAGFDVMRIPKNDLLDQADQARMSLASEQEVILCRKL